MTKFNPFPVLPKAGIFHLALTIAVTLFAGGTVAQTPPKPLVELWVSPNLQADTKAMDASTKPTILASVNTATWGNAFQGMTVFNAHYSDMANTPFWNSQTAKDFINNSRSMGKKISVSVAGIYPRAGNCTNLGYLGDSAEGAEIANKFGANVDYILMDGVAERAFLREDYQRDANGNPYMCPVMDYDYIRGQIATYMTLMKARFPNVKFILGVNFPHWNYTNPANGAMYPSITARGGLIKAVKNGVEVVLDYKDVLNDLVSTAASNGVPFYGFSIDNPYNYIANTLVSVPSNPPSYVASTNTAESNTSIVETRWARLNGLIQQAKTLGLKTYVMTNSEQFPSGASDDSVLKSQYFHDQTFAYSKALVDRQTHPTNPTPSLNGHIVTSWFDTKVGTAYRTVPKSLLGEFDSYSFTNTVKDVYNYINIQNESIYGVVGYIDGTVGSASTKTLVGWACGQYNPQPITVHLYSGGPSGSGGVYAGFYTANVSSEPAVATQCKTTGNTYRFSIPIAGRFTTGTPLYVYGISPYGGTVKLLMNSGSFSAP